MSRNLVRPYFPVPPSEYSQTYIAEVVRAFSVYLVQMQNPGEGRNTTIVLTNLQENDVGLEIGALFQQDGFVKVARIGSPHPAGVAATGAVGSVTTVVS